MARTRRLDRAIAIATTSVALLGPLTSRAEEPGRAAASRATAGTLASLASQLAAGLDVPSPAWVVVGPLTRRGAPAPEPELEKLRERVRLVVASALATTATRSAAPLDFAEARRQARGAHRTLVYLSPRLDGENLLLGVDVVTWPSSFWQRARNPEGIVTAHLALAAKMDAEVRGFLPRPRALFERRAAFGAPVADVVALSCGTKLSGDVDLVVVGRRELARGRFEGSQFIVTAKRAWSELSPVAPAPLRAPLARALHTESGVRVGASDRAEQLLLDDALEPIGRSVRGLPLDDERCASLSATGVTEAAWLCRFGSSPGAAVGASPAAELSFAARVDAATSDADGIVTRWALRVPASGGKASLAVLSPLRADRRLELEVGSVVAIDDLDGDGKAELLSSAPTPSAAADALRVQTWSGDAFGAPLELPLPSLSALAVCPFDGENPLSVIVASGDKLWLLS